MRPVPSVRQWAPQGAGLEHPCLGIHTLQEQAWRLRGSAWWSASANSGEGDHSHYTAVRLPGSPILLVNPIEELHHTGFQRVLGADDAQPLVQGESLDQLGAVS